MSAADVLSGSRRWHVDNADCREWLARLPDASVDACVTDPPAGIAFMGKDWDRDKGGRDAWIAWLRGIMGEVLRVLKPGGHALVWALPRTSHWTATAVEDAGFEIREVGVHLFGTGFPKSLNVSKAIDAAAGAERPVIGRRQFAATNSPNFRDDGWVPDLEKLSQVTAPATPEAAQWDGWGTALKPAAEHWILARRPLDGTVAANVLAHGTGALNVDECRIGDVDTRSPTGNRDSTGWGTKAGAIAGSPLGRWPANVTLDEEAAALLDEQSGDRPGGRPVPSITPSAPLGGPVFGQGLERQAFEGYNDSGGASRFFYVAKPSTEEREAGCEHLPKRAAAELTDSEEGQARLDCPRTGAGRTSSGRANHHPTVKSIALMRWLVRLVTPPGGIVLDPFTGSGTTGCAAMLEKFRFVGCDMTDDYVDIARARIAHWDSTPEARQQTLFGGAA